MLLYAEYISSAPACMSLEDHTYKKLLTNFIRIGVLSNIVFEATGSNAAVDYQKRKVPHSLV